jgi:hypothetical protein
LQTVESGQLLSSITSPSQIPGDSLAYAGALVYQQIMLIQFCG